MSQEKSDTVSMETSKHTLLFNACNEEILVETSKGKYLQLPRAPRPELLCAPEEPESVIFTVPVLNKPGTERVFNMNATCTLYYYKSIKEYGILEEPIAIPGALFVVEPEDLFQFPDREDFVCPATWAMVRKDEVKKKMKKKAWRDYRESLPYSQSRELKNSVWVSVLAGVTRHPYATKTINSIHIDW